MQKKRHRQFLTIIVALLVPILPFAIIGEMPGERWLSATDENAWLFGLTGGGLLLGDIILPLPSSIIGTLLGARLGLAPGFLIALVGLTAGHAAGYFLGRLALRRVGADLPEVPTLLIVFLSRPVPVLAEAVAIAAGASRMPVAHYLGIAFAGNVIYAAVLAANGAMLLPDALLGPGLFIPMLLPVVAWAIWRWAS
ncbi:VTT domain-containing protein [Lentisalinibacter salinarum]|uniref:VTT domain-containing protein n=1 Tax=Lentisalinibacter salinarum TaxID=2992239 RepID=UPI0038643B2D